MRSWSFAKGHGTQNDFVLLVDPDGSLDLGADEVRWLCDRRAGVGGDGVLRAVRAAAVDDWQGDGALWFMDYRNADGSVAEMCGNGVRVFAHHLLAEGLLSGRRFDIATRAGVRPVEVLDGARYRVEMGPVRVEPGAVTVTAATGEGERSWPATAVDVGNPHAVVLLGPADPQLASLELHVAPRWRPADVFPEGVNVEFVRSVGERHLQMRVHERGSGETRSCGTGTVAAVAASARSVGAAVGTWRVDVPGGTVEVELAEGTSYLTGPAEVVAHGQVLLPTG
ncbi:diaminopimelate epimerase [Auraticoccus sp. F435]|uniref:Diaminopimelate epimerase n=1 Tax=Auraticoccus cholistanensis TaxID=2656650 RepID=A0A6A9USK1_9ACTN|nr:diaminopimelate epimerase [Auraticoccus cholistanensis]MVA75671.1 diaminopimelate epimerase [Auraticoccus cholistanensis]